MPRTARVVVPGHPHHVTQRGVRKQQTFFCEADYLAYLAIVSSVSVRVGVQIWAYCLMLNHVHFIAVPDQADGLARLFGFAHHHYAVRVNAMHGWQGHLWQERFRSQVIANDEYLLATVRYVERNPVDAGLVRRAEDWRWSSVHAHLNNAPDDLVTVPPMLEGITDWRSFLAEDTDPKVLDAIRT